MLASTVEVDYRTFRQVLVMPGFDDSPDAFAVTHHER